MFEIFSTVSKESVTLIDNKCYSQADWVGLAFLLNPTLSNICVTMKLFGLKMSQEVLTKL